MQNIIQKLSENVQLIYRKAIDADNAITKLQAAGKGKFLTIFSPDAGFEAQSKHFKPYVEELAQDVANLSELSEAELKLVLPTLVKKIEHMFTTLANFQLSIKQ
jgi:phospholipase/lecithinase/hemolysin